MRPIRQYKPAPKNTSANRIRERYLHQLGLQRGGAPLSAPHLSQSNHVVVISGLPSLPEDRATTEHVMESYDFSVSRHSHHTGATNSVDSRSSGGESDSGSAHEIHTKQIIPCSGDSYSHCSKSTLSISPAQREANEALTSMALAYPTALRKVPAPVEPNPPQNNNFAPSPAPVPWRTTSLSKPATVLLDSVENRGDDQGSVSSVGTSTTAESSLTAMVSRDWGSVPHAPSAAVSVSSLGGESPASTPGVYFQCGHPRLLSSSAPGPGVHCATSSLAHALNRFNIDSDCEASVASASVVEDHMMEDDDASIDDAASRASVASVASAGSSKSATMRSRKKIGKTQRLMDRAAAHERILQIRSDRSQKMRANLVQSQRMGNPVTVSGLSMAMAQEEQISVSPGSASSSQASIPLMHVEHGKPGRASAQESQLPPHAMCALGRTPTASNCSELRKLQGLVPPSQYLNSLPAGVHVEQRGPPAVSPPRAMAPLGLPHQLASRLPTPPPPQLVSAMVPSSGDDEEFSSASTNTMLVQPEVESRDVDDSDSASLHHVEHQATVDEVMEVAMTLSKLGSAKTGPIPRIR